MPTNQFIRDRKRGRIGQDYVATMLRSWGLKVENVADGFFQAYDLVVTTPNGRRTLEIKYDIRASDTGRLCLELDALWHSRADLLAIVVGNPIKTIYLLPLQPALQLAESWPKKFSVGERGEEAALIPLETFILKLNPQILTINQ